MMELSERGQAFRSAIAAFIDGRREAKLKGLEDDGERAAKYAYPTWLADAARRVSQIQAVTHVLKATHPDARGTNLHVAPATLPPHPEIGSQVLGEDFAEDVVGNAAALDVFKFLKLEVDGRRLLDWMQAKDPDLAQALNEDTPTAQAWMEAFSGLVRQETSLVSHPAAKQVYWLLGDNPSDNRQFHLLQPLFSSSLAQAVHGEIQDARFGEANGAARKAKRQNQPWDGTYRDYPHLAVRKLGGTKPQNISQLNSERGGNNYLLASLPPPRREEQAPRLLNLDSALERFGAKKEVVRLTRALADFLLTDPPPNDATRERRRQLEQALGMELPLFAAQVRASLEPGWSRHPDCRLPLWEQLWLDPERLDLPDRPEHLEEDQAFRTAYYWGDWPDQVAGRFANWLNDRLRKAGLTALGDAEYRHWARQAVMDAAWPVPQQRRAGESA